MIEVLRLSHRKDRDKRITIHIALSLRVLAPGSVMYYSGDKDCKLESNINQIQDKWGKAIEIKYTTNVKRLILSKKKEGFIVIHLTMYGTRMEERINEIKNKNKILIVIGSEKVPGWMYELADYNISVGNQPHSELTALALLLYELNDCALKDKEIKGNIEIVPQEKGKKVIKNA